MTPNSDARETAWFAVHDALPPFWQVGPPTYDPTHHVWYVTARSQAGRGKPPTTVTGEGEDEIEALHELDARLRGYPRPADEQAKWAYLDRRLRLAFYQGAEDWSRDVNGRPLTDDEAGVALPAFQRYVDEGQVGP